MSVCLSLCLTVLVWLSVCLFWYCRRRLAMVTQAGVAIGLAKNVADRIPDWGPDFTALLMAVIVLNQVIVIGELTTLR
jgi:hypothetical protein